MNPVFDQIDTSVFETMSRLASERRAVNLGQGFPDDPGPEDVRAKAAEAVLNGWNQYPPMLGLPELRHAVAAHYKRFQGLELDPETEVMVTSGATEALAGSLFALIEPGDEVVLIQPMYDAYLPLVRRAGGVPKFVTLRPPDWAIEETELAAAFSGGAKVLLVNNPHNPIGVVHRREALALIAKHCRERDAIALCDEVWEHLTFDGLKHTSMMTIEGMRERTIKIGSAGKIFSLTGWKVGFVCAEAAILRTLARAHQFITFTTPPNLQSAVAYGLMKDDDYFDSMRARFQRSRDRFSKGLTECGFSVLPSSGTYFVAIDISALGHADDAAFCRWLVETHGVAAIPISAFYETQPIRTVVRFCFAKNDATLDAALARLSRVAALAAKQ
jgi:aspartate/methionine/tyrosine aminotransferase